MYSREVYCREGLRLKVLVLHDDTDREYAYGPAEGASRHHTKSALISMKNDLFRF
jgi:hypothetical protein